MNIGDIAGLSQPLTRLIEVLSAGVGAVYQPYLVRNMADARAYEIRTIGEAISEVAEQNNLPIQYKTETSEMWKKIDDGTLILTSTEADSRIEKRIDYRERKRQQNIETITQAAASELARLEQVADEKPDDDWISRFFNSAQDISSEEMQHLWGQILAGEIKNPGTYSLRTIDFIRNLTRAEAELFQRVGKLALSQGETWFVAANNKKWLETHRKIREMDHFLLGELGILYPSDLTILTKQNSGQKSVLFSSEEYSLLIELAELKSNASLRIWKFTGIGRELLSLISKPFDEEYLECIGRHYIKSGAQAKIGKIINRSGSGEIELDFIKTISTES